MAESTEQQTETERSLLQLPQGALMHILSNLHCLSDTATCQLVSRELLEAVKARFSLEHVHQAQQDARDSHTCATIISFYDMARYLPCVAPSFVVWVCTVRRLPLLLLPTSTCV